MPKIQPPPRGRHALRFEYDQEYQDWNASIRLDGSPFGRDMLNVIISGGTAWEPPTNKEMALIDSILDRLPEIIPSVTLKLKGMHLTLEDPKAFREAFSQPQIWLPEREHQLSGRWVFVVERQGFEGDNWGVHLEFVGDEFQRMFAGD